MEEIVGLTASYSMLTNFPGQHYSKYSGSVPKKIWKFPSVLFGDSDGLVRCACWNSHTTWGWQRSGFLVVITLLLILAAVFVPYCVAMGVSAMSSVLPFISQAGGSPPMTGIFAIFMILLAFESVLPFVIMYESFNHRNVKGLRLMKIANKIALVTITVAFFGCIVTIANPVGYTSLPSKFEWLVTVLFEHSLGAAMALFGIAFYQFLLTYMYFLLPDTSKRMRFVRLAFCVSYLLLFLISVKPMPDYILEELGPEPFNIQLLKSTTYELPLTFSTAYKIAAFCEWLVVLFSGVHFITMFKDLQRVSFHVVLRHKSCFKDTLEPAPSITLKTLSS